MSKDALDEIARELGVKVMDKCKVCGKGHTFLIPCQYCNGAFCEEHAGENEHECKALM